MSHNELRFLRLPHSFISEFIYYLKVNAFAYYFAADNYLPVEKIIPEKKTGEKPFIKLSRKIDPGEAGKTVDYGLETFNLFASLLRS